MRPVSPDVRLFNGKSGASGKGLVECLYRKQVYPHHTPHPMSPRQSQRLQTAEDQNSILWEVEHKRFWIQGLQIMEGMRVLWKQGEGWGNSTVAKTGGPEFNPRNPHCGRRDMTFSSCPMTSTYTLWPVYAWTHPHAHTYTKHKHTPSQL